MSILVWLSLLLGGDDYTAGMRAYQEGRFPEALQAFARAQQVAGDEASPELLYNLSLAALATGDLIAAEIAAEKAAVRGGPEYRPMRDFLLGNAAFARCIQAEGQAAATEAEPFALDLAIMYARKARDSWQSAAMTRPDWPEARRNVERALLKLAELEQKRAEAEKKRQEEERKKQSQPEEQPQLLPDDQPPNPQVVREAPQLSELSPDQVMRLLDRLIEKEREKIESRQAERRARSARVERDW